MLPNQNELSLKEKIMKHFKGFLALDIPMPVYVGSGLVLLLLAIPLFSMTLSVFGAFFAGIGIAVACPLIFAGVKKFLKEKFPQDQNQGRQIIRTSRGSVNEGGSVVDNSPKPEPVVENAPNPVPEVEKAKQYLRRLRRGIFSK